MNNDKSKQTENINHSNNKTMESENITRDNDDLSIQESKSSRGGYCPRKRSKISCSTSGGQQKSTSVESCAQPPALA